MGCGNYRIKKYYKGKTKKGLGGFNVGQTSPEENPVEEGLYIEPNPTEEEIKEQIEVIEKVNDAMDVAEKVATSKITHKGYPEDSIAQNVVRYAYQLGGMDFVYVFECENGTYDMKREGDNGHAHGLCQINDLYHKDIPENYETDWRVAVEYCYQKWKEGTPFYGPSRVSKATKGMRCSKYVESRFIIG